MLVGLEIHQRLAGSKLFNACPTPRPDEPLNPSAPRLRRYLVATSSEMGGVDDAASFEAGRLRSFEYAAQQGYTCLVDTDEEPPNDINREALTSALRFAHSIGAKIADEMHVMRKIVLDGSNTSGFQRTMLVSMGGKLECAGKKIPIQTICLEEESAGIIPASEGRAAYRLDRLGIPLIEIATDPCFYSPEEAMEGAQAIGMALRTLPNVMRGLGTIRQDVNVSVPGGARVEIKGMQDLKTLPLLVKNEAERQNALIALAKEMDENDKLYGQDEDSQMWMDITDLLKESACKITSRAIAQGGVVLAARLENFSGILGRKLYEGRRFGTEISDYAKIAGGVHGLIHSDEDLEKYSFTQDEIDDITSALKVGESDGFILIADLEHKAEAAMEAAIRRSRMRGVIPETRKADDKGGSSFMRPMAGAHRMYPETDIRPIAYSHELAKIAAIPLESMDERKGRLITLLGAELGEQMSTSQKLKDFESLLAAGADPKLAAVTLEQTMTSLRREGVKVDSIAYESIEEMFMLYKKNRITKAAISEILRHLALGHIKSSEQVVIDNGLERISGERLKKLFASEGGDMKAFMSKHRLRVDGADIAKLAK